MEDMEAGKDKRKWEVMQVRRGRETA